MPAFNDPSENMDTPIRQAAKDGRAMLGGLCLFSAGHDVIFAKNFGPQYLGVGAFFGVFFGLPVFFTFAQNVQPHELVFLTGYWLLQMFLLVVKGSEARSGKIRRHSGYVGDTIGEKPGACRKVGPELAGSLVLAFVAMFASPVLGAYIAASGIASAVCMSALTQRDRRIAQKMFDAQVEGEHMQRLYRDRFGR